MEKSYEQYIVDLLIVTALLFIGFMLGFSFATNKVEKSCNHIWMSYANNDVFQMDGNQYRVIRLNKDHRLEE